MQRCAAPVHSPIPDLIIVSCSVNDGIFVKNEHARRVNVPYNYHFSYNGVYDMMCREEGRRDAVINGIDQVVNRQVWMRGMQTYVQLINKNTPLRY